MSLTAEVFAAIAPIHPDSLDDYRRWEALLRKWNARINLVAPNSVNDFWQRHALDSAQLLPLIRPETRTIADFGSGAGFPGLAIAIDAKQRGLDRTVHLIESAGKKANFLKTVSRETYLQVIVHADRIEAVEPLNADLITARAFAPLDRLLPLASRHLAKDGTLLLLKGETASRELETVRASWSFDVDIVKSQSDHSGLILQLGNLAPH